MATTGTTAAAKFIPELWGSPAQRALQNNLVMAKRVYKIPFPGGRKVGSKNNIPIVSNLSASAVTAGAVTPTATTEGEVEITLNRHFYSAVEVEDIVQVQSQYDLLEEYSGKVAFALDKQVDTDLAGDYSTLSQQGGTSGVAIIEDVTLNAVQFLDEADCPESDRTQLYRPASKRAMVNIENFINASKRGMANEKGPLIKGLFGEIYGIPVFFSNNVQSSSGIHNLIFWREGFALMMQMEPKMEFFDRIALTKVLVGSALWGHAEYRDSAAVDVLT